MLKIGRIRIINIELIMNFEWEPVGVLKTAQPKIYTMITSKFKVESYNVLLTQIL